MKRLICALVLALLIATPCLGQQPLVGSYKLVSVVIEIDGVPNEIMGKAPHGYIVFTPTRVIQFYTAENRKFGTSVADKAALFDTLVASSGMYRIEGDKLITIMDASWVENLNGKTVVLKWQLSGNLLTLTHDPIPWPVDPSKTLVNRRVWEKVE